MFTYKDRKERLSKETLDNERKYRNNFNKGTYKSFLIRFNQNTEQEIIDYINSQDSINNYIRNLIIKDMNKTLKTKIPLKENDPRRK